MRPLPERAAKPVYIIRWQPANSRNDPPFTALKDQCAGLRQVTILDVVLNRVENSD